MSFCSDQLPNQARKERFTQRNLLRIFPRSTRNTSSNYNPLMGWRYGVQMVAANMQGHGRKLWLTQGMFRANGGCGYVKKPDILMYSDPDKMFNPESNLPVKTRLKATVYMRDGWRFDFRKTHFDKCSPPDFYARVRIAGDQGDHGQVDTYAGSRVRRVPPDRP